MKGKSLGGLIVLNVALFIALALFSFFGQPQQAQGQFAGGRGGDYLMLGYAPPGRQAWNAAIITDLNSGKMIAVRLERKQLKVIGYRDISKDAAAAGANK